MSDDKNFPRKFCAGPPEELSRKFSVGQRVRFQSAAIPSDEELESLSESGPPPDVPPNGAQDDVWMTGVIVGLSGEWTSQEIKDSGDGTYLCGEIHRQPCYSILADVDRRTYRVPEENIEAASGGWDSERI